MRILVLSNLYPPHFLGGYELLCRDVTEALAERGHEVHVLTSDHGGPAPSPPYAVERSLELTRPIGADPQASLARRLTVTRRNARLAEEALDRVQPDVVFAWNQNRISLGPLYAAQELGVPTCLTLNDAHMRQFAPAPLVRTARGLLRRGAERWLDPRLTFEALDLRFSTCISAALARQLAGLGFPAERLRVIHQGVPLRRFTPRPLPAALGSPPVILYAGQLHPDKGVEHLLNAAGLLARGGQRFRLEVVGGGSAEDAARLQRAAAAAGCAEQVAFRGRQPREAMPQLYRAADVLVFPSVWEEPFGLTHLEAMACGVPVVSTAVGGCAEFLQHERNALVVPPADPQALADALDRVLSEGALRARLAVGGLGTVRRDLNLGRYVDALEGLLQEACAARCALGSAA